MVAAIELLLTIGGIFFRYFGASDEQMKWLVKAADRLREKGWVRNNFVLELEKDRHEHLDKRLKEMEQKKDGSGVDQ